MTTIFTTTQGTKTPKNTIITKIIFPKIRVLLAAFFSERFWFSTFPNPIFCLPTKFLSKKY